MGPGSFFIFREKRGRVRWVKYVAEFNRACCEIHRRFPASGLIGYREVFLSTTSDGTSPRPAKVGTGTQQHRKTRISLFFRLVIKARRSSAPGRSIVRKIACNPICQQGTILGICAKAGAFRSIPDKIHRRIRVSASVYSIQSVAFLDIVQCPVARNHPDPLLRRVRATCFLFDSLTN